MNRFAQLVRSWVGGAGDKPIGLEVGSWQTRVWWQGRVVWSQPSIAVFHVATGRPVAVGERAAQMRGRLPSSMRLWLPTDRGQWRFSAEMPWYLKAVVDSVLPSSRRWLDWPVTLVGPVAATPSYLRGVQQVCREAGLSVSKQLTQPEAAWGWYLKQQLLKEQGCVLVMGHGVSQVGFFQGNESVAQQEIAVGGQDIADALSLAIRQEHQLEVSNQVIYDLQQQMLELGEPKANTKKIVKGKHVLKRVPETAVVTQEMLRAAAQPPLTQLLQQLQQFVRSLSSETVAVLLQQGMMVTGGSSQVAGLRQWLESELKLPVIVSRQPLHDVIQGVGSYASQSRD